MALLSISQTQLVYSDGECSRTALFAIKNVDGGDTVDTSPWFSVVKRAGFVSDTGTHILAATIGANGTTLTVPAGPLDDAMWLIVVGVSV